MLNRGVMLAKATRLRKQEVWRHGRPMYVRTKSMTRALRELVRKRIEQWCNV